MLGLLRTVLLSLVISSLLAVLRYGLSGFNLVQFGPLALLVLWMTLLSTFWLCLLHRVQAHFPPWILALVALSGIVLISGLVSWAVNTWSLSRAGSAELPLASIYENMLIAFLIAAVILRFLAVHAQLQQRDQQLGAARFEALQARIRPHFLFNTLNSIASLIRTQPEAAETAVLDLSDMMRTSLGRKNEDWTLADEVDICLKYLAIEKLRMGERLDWELRFASQARGLKFPQLALQPLVENAVLHGIQSRPEGGKLALYISYTGPLLELELRNPLAEQDDHAGSGQALSNTEARLRALFPEVRRFVAGTEGHEYVARLTLEVAS